MPWQYHGYHSYIQGLRFIMHSEKLMIISKQINVCLMFVISPTNVALSLTDEKKTKIKNSQKIYIVLEQSNWQKDQKTNRQSSCQTFGKQQFQDSNITIIILIRKLVMKGKQKYNGGSTIFIISATSLVVQILTLGYK